MIQVVLAFLGALALLAVIYGAVFNMLVARRNSVRDSWATIDTELQRRHELVPRLVEAVKAAAAHEQDVLVRAAEANARALAAPTTPRGVAATEPAVVAAAGELLALRERYPQLNAQQNFLDLQDELTITEDRVAAARRFYNMQVAKLNRACETFPSSIVATRHRFERAEYLEF